MPKSSRLTREEMAALFQGRSRRVRGTCFDLAYAPVAKGPKMACVVSKKVAAKAVDRNRIRRRVRSVLHALLSGVSAPVALVFHARPEARSASFDEMRSDMAQLAEKALSSYNRPI